MNSSFHVLTWVSGIATLAFAAVMIAAVVVAITKLQKFNRPSKWLLAAISCILVPLIVRFPLNIALSQSVSSDQFAMISIGFGIAQTIFSIVSIVFFVAAVYSDRHATPRTDREEFLSGSSGTRVKPDVENPFESPQS